METRGTTGPDALPETQFAKIVKRKDISLVSADPIRRLLTNDGKSLLASSTLNFSVSLSRSSMCGEIKGDPVKILVDTGSSENVYPPR